MKKDTRNPARMVLFFSFCFVFMLFVAIIIRFLEIRMGELRTLPGPPETKLPEFISALQWALVPALYMAILQGLSYSSQRNIPIPLAVSSLLILALAAVLGISLGVERLRALPSRPVLAAPALSGEKGLILSQSGAAIIILQGPGDLRGPRVVSLPGQSLIYQDAPRGPDNTVLPLPPLPFRNETTPFLTSLFIDFTLTARQFEERLRGGILSLGLYAGALILLLVSLRFVLDIGSWPLASLFLGALAFRGILALETFLNTPEVQELIHSFLGEWFSPALITPLIFGTLALIILFYTALVHLVKGRRARHG